ncbi:MAG: SPW repeat protein [Bauldia sp.]|nr:SPW repeat protein [Bauldia sp.]
MQYERWPIWLSALIGVVVFAMPWLLGDVASTGAAPLSDAANWNLWIAGAIMVVLSLAAIANYRPWEEWVTALIGVWLIASPWVFGFTAASTMAWSVGIAGGVLVVLGLWSVFVNSNGRSYAA